MDGWLLASVFAQGAHDPTNTVGMVVVALLSLLSGGLVIKQLLEKRADKEAVPRKEFEELKGLLTTVQAGVVTRKEYDELKAQVTTNAAQVVALTSKLVDYVTRREIDDLRTAVNQQYEKLERYARSRSHKLTAQVHEIQMGIEVLHRNMQAEMSGLINRVTEKQERHQTALTELRAIVERRLPKSDEETP